LYASTVVIIDVFGAMIGGVLGDAFGYDTLFGAAIGLCAAGCVALVWGLDRYARTGRIAHAWGRAPAVAG
jgi:hypothetical protein